MHHPNPRSQSSLSFLFACCGRWRGRRPTQKDEAARNLCPGVHFGTIDRDRPELFNPPTAVRHLRAQFSAREAVHEHLVQSSIGVRRVAELLPGVATGSPPRPGQRPNAVEFTKRGPAVVNMQKEAAPRADDSGDVAKHFSSVFRSLDHSQGAEETNRMVGTVGRKAIEFDQVGTNRMNAADRRGIRDFLRHHLQHAQAEVDCDNAITALGKGQGIASAAASEIQNHFG